MSPKSDRSLHTNTHTAVTCNLHIYKSAENTHFFDLRLSERTPSILYSLRIGCEPEETVTRISVGYCPACTTGRHQKKFQQMHTSLLAILLTSDERNGGIPFSMLLPYCITKSSQKQLENHGL